MVQRSCDDLFAHANDSRLSVEPRRRGHPILEPGLGNKCRVMKHRADHDCGRSACAARVLGVVGDGGSRAAVLHRERDAGHPPRCHSGSTERVSSQRSARQRHSAKPSGDRPLWPSRPGSGHQVSAGAGRCKRSAERRSRHGSPSQITSGWRSHPGPMVLQSSSSASNRRS